jgi:phage protein U
MMLQDTEGNSQPEPLVAGLVKLNGKYYLELENYENSELENAQRLVELSIALARENEAQRERISILEDRLRAYSDV